MSAIETTKGLFPEIQYQRTTLKVTTGTENPVVYHGPVTVMTSREVLEALRRVIEGSAK